jgi:hypothetical protein
MSSLGTLSVAWHRLLLPVEEARLRVGASIGVGIVIYSIWMWASTQSDWMEWGIRDEGLASYEQRDLDSSAHSENCSSFLFASMAWCWFFFVPDMIAISENYPKLCRICRSGCKMRIFAFCGFSLRILYFHEARGTVKRVLPGLYSFL